MSDSGGLGGTTRRGGRAALLTIAADGRGYDWQWPADGGRRDTDQGGMKDVILRFRWLAVMVTLALALVAGTAVAHEDPAQSDPAGGSVVNTLPEQITITFPGELDAEGSSITIRDPDGNDVTSDDAGVDLDNPDRNTLVAPLDGDLPDGEYSVEWVALSLSDGHETSGEFSFTVDPDAPETASPVVAAPESTTTPMEVEDVADDDDGGISRGALIIGAVAVTVALTVVASVGSRRWRR